MSATIAPAPQLDDVDEGARGGRRRVLVVLVVLLVGVAAGVTGFLLLGPDAASAEGADTAVAEGEVIELSPLTTTTGTAALHHARVGLGLVLSEGTGPDAVSGRTPLLQDALLREMATMDADHLRSAAGSDQLRANLTEHAQTIWPEGEVVRVVLTELLVQ